MEEKTTTYTNHSGEKIDVSTLHPTHLWNALAKKMESVFNAKTKDEAYQIINEINALKEEAFKRINTYVESLSDNDGE